MGGLSVRACRERAFEIAYFSDVRINSQRSLDNAERSSIAKPAKKALNLLLSWRGSSKSSPLCDLGKASLFSPRTYSRSLYELFMDFLANPYAWIDPMKRNGVPDDTSGEHADSNIYLDNLSSQRHIPNLLWVGTLVRCEAAARTPRADPEIDRQDRSTATAASPALHVQARPN